MWTDLVPARGSKQAVKRRGPTGRHYNPILNFQWASLVTQMVKDPPAMQETWVWSLGWEDPLEQGMTTHSSILAWRTPWTEEFGGLHSMGSPKVRHDCMINTFTVPGDSAVKNPPAMQETPVQSLGQEDPLEKEMAAYSNILAWEIPRTRAWRAIVHGVTKSRTWLSD